MLTWLFQNYMKLIQELTPKLNQTQRRLIESTLNNLGVKHIDDLVVIEPTDLTEAMTVVQARKLCLAIKARQEQLKGSSNSAESGESLFNSLSSPIDTSTPDSPSPIPQSSQSSQSSTSSDSIIFCSQKTTSTADNP
ncbi:hypothetical protein LOTGIDRAFT_158070 [Lottia gigantea]|uniref:Uncharacterized protein n=1 Tax=Lottia gigantea TaxID=225164 RepID=V4ARQ2_LOTGI|nr:hypothetical protein LOTGIDRAFT_158070 [Lottia gigantea]ESO99912.1 hypothetical protein LOTGIDRAFT_158070 [Lottia gigantea]